MNQINIICGDALEELKKLPRESVHCCVTSPPYWGLRDYGGEGQLGLEETPAKYIDKMIAVFQEVKRVLRNDGTAWVNMGDGYATGGGNTYKTTDDKRKEMGEKLFGSGHINKSIPPGLKPKDLIGMPWRLALALQQPDLICGGCSAINHESRWGRFPNGRRICPECEKSKGAEVYAPGWWLRSDIIWHKPNPMPESATDRCTKSHEYIFLLTKSGDKLYWTHRDRPGTREKPKPDYRWVKDGQESTTPVDGWQRINLWTGHDYYYDAEAIREEAKYGYREQPSDTWDRCKKEGERVKGATKGGDPSAGRNKRTVWTIPTAPYPGAHYATFPPALPEICIKAGTSEKGCCPECGAPWERVVEKAKIGKADSNTKFDDSMQAGPLAKSRQAYRAQGLEGPPAPVTTGWQPTCDHSADPIPCTVLDPFNGHGTTGLVAARLGRSYIGIELNAGDVEATKKRIEADNPMFNQVATVGA